MKIPVTWLSICPDNPARGRWDQQIIEDLLDQRLWRLPDWDFVEEPITSPSLTRIVVFPCGHYQEHDCGAVAHAQIHALAATHHNLIIIATSDETGSYDWSDLPDNARLWVQTPDPKKDYPPGTNFFPLGNPHSRLAPREVFKHFDVSLVGQDSHQRRHACFDAVEDLEVARPDLHIMSARTPGFTQGMEPSAYMDLMRATRVAPCPAGAVSPETFRMYEALDCGAVPILDGTTASGNSDPFYWQRLLPPARPGVGIDPITLSDWSNLGDWVDVLTPDRSMALTACWWQRWKRDIALQLDYDLKQMVGGVRSSWVGDQISVVIPTSPIPSHPSPGILNQTLDSIRLATNAQIHVLFDGVRKEQQHLADNYWQYVRERCASFNRDPKILPWVFTRHHHQSGMFRRVLDEIDTRYVLFVEHDTPLEGRIDFDEVIDVMERDEIASMRFHHETHILDSSAHLFLETEGTAEQPYLRTIQWSQRPHLARTDWYRDIMATYFGRDSRTMIEDVMHGAVQHRHAGNPTGVRKGWEKWRMAVWAPPGDNIKRSGHLDGREQEEKFEMFIAYDHERPDGAPPEGWWR